MSQTGKRASTAAESEAAAKRRKDDEEPKKSAYESQLEKLAESASESNSTVTDESNWERPPFDQDLGTKRPVAMQVLDVETYVDSGKGYDRTNVKLYGITKEGVSVCCIVTDYFPYFYFQTAQRNLNNLLAGAIRRIGSGGQHMSTEVTDNLVHLKIVQGRNLYYYRGTEAKQMFIKVSGTQPTLNKAKQVGTLFEANIDADVKFMAHTGVVGCGWVEVPIKKGHVVPPRSATSRCQIEVTCNYKDLIVHSLDGEWVDIAPLRTLSFDIECLGRRGVFPDPTHDSVIQISNMVKLQGQSEPFIRNCFVLGTCAGVVGSHIIECKTEQELLEKWAAFVRTVDPDILTGYNILNFDLPYILDRAKILRLPIVSMLGRQKDRASGVRDASLSSKQMGSRVNKSIDIHGRVIFDVLQVVLRDYKLRSYTLNSVAYHFLSEQKEDVEHSTIPDLQNGDDQSRRRLAIYCMKDSTLPLRLLDKLMSIVNYVEMARVTGVPLNFLLTRGQQIKILSMMIRRCRKEGFFLPVIEVNAGDDSSYEGATVIDPLRGFYNEPIATLDFASLYPSIMIAHNLCYTTLMKGPQGEEGTDYIRTPAGNFFCTKERRRGLLPLILEDLLAARKKAKNDLKKEKDEFKKMVYNGRQLALKVSANSVYGFTGATVGKLPCLEISSSVTAFGRQMIDLTKKTVEETYKRGYMDGKCPSDAVVVYGDTDSVMVKFGVKTVAEAMEIGQHAATEVSKQFVAPIRLEFEKVYYPYLLINKKRYAGLYFTRPDKHDKMDCKGLETVRRDNCPLVANVLGTCLEKLLVDRNADGAMTYAKKVIADLLCNKIDISLLIISKELTKSSDKYHAKQAHVELAARMKKRDPGSAPRLGDRVPYVIVAAAKNVPAYEKAEDPGYNDIPIDTHHYLTNQLAKPLARIFEPILGDRAEKILIEGDHTRTRQLKTSKVGGLAMFTKKTTKCLGCKSVMKADEQEEAVCAYCRPKVAEVHLNRVTTLNATSRRFGRLWTECQNCAKTMHEKVNCSARDCPIFYRREKVRGEMREAFSAVMRFGQPTLDD
ncbi:hypothetical protein PRIPAC_71957 [Pristionchus pacificus]|uniref:DNA polymerase n=1 Tax=Pristionchus pacificus TaxID=54126 RepID=A0A2A6BRV9_PRIPA|nr:hypothetical protein PRIPAC_71957 [Pristionchus pacificus]|eukprot:PDM68533.1 hypothetical protein PRIPAC_44035 [Pristionchus pacificus]